MNRWNRQRKIKIENENVDIFGVKTIKERIKHMRIYISGPITGIDDYMERFKTVESQLMQEGHTVVNPAAIMQHMPPDTVYEEYMRLSIELLQMCDCIYMMRGWNVSCGANREYGYALAKDKMIIRE
jgi:nucleoside 2-deoxyribosyltransferase